MRSKHIKKIEDIARKTLYIDNLDTRNHDRLDFYEVAVWQINAALIEAFEAGQQSVRECKECS